MFELFSIPMLLIYSALFGMNMKMADCFNEHGFKWFRGDSILFGMIFGLFGGLVIASRPELTNLYLSLLLVNVLRFRVDRLNHGIAANIMFFGFLLSINNFMWQYFLYFFITFAIFGLIMDVISPKVTLNKFWKYLLEIRIFYFVFTFLFSIYTNIWLVFISMAIFQLSYNLTSKLAQKSPNYIK
tara:strand:- start:229 stop:783 length:555 start_codon:yes stop_codon:yes gene_type:complete